MPMMPSTFRPLPKAAKRFQAPDQDRYTAQERGYTSRWKTARASYLARHPLCVMCHAEGRATAATVVDHIVPHRLADALDSGDAERIRLARERFWDSSNWQSLCTAHHSGAKQAIERASMQRDS